MDAEVYKARIDAAATDVLADPDLWYSTIGPLAGLFTERVSSDILANLRARGIDEADLPHLGGW